MILQLDIAIGTSTIKQVKVETNLNPDQVDWPDSITGILLDFEKKDWVALFEPAADGPAVVRQDVTVGFKGKRYKFSRLESDGSFELKKDW